MKVAEGTEAVKAVCFSKVVKGVLFRQPSVWIVVLAAVTLLGLAAPPAWAADPAVDVTEPMTAPDGSVCGVFHLKVRVNPNGGVGIDYGFSDVSGGGGSVLTATYGLGIVRLDGPQPPWPTVYTDGTDTRRFSQHTPNYSRITALTLAPGSYVVTASMWAHREYLFYPTSLCRSPSVEASFTVPNRRDPDPTEEPTDEPTIEPTDEPTIEPTDEPTIEPTDEPTVEPTDPGSREEPTIEESEDSVLSGLFSTGFALAGFVFAPLAALGVL